MSLIYRNLESRGGEKIANNQLTHSNSSLDQPIYSEFILIYCLFLIYSIVFFLFVFLIWQLIKKDMLIKKKDKRIRDLTELLIDLEKEVQNEAQKEIELVKKNKLIKNLKKEEEKEIDYEILSYSDKSFVVRGNTKKHKDKLKEFGNYNPNLIGGPGWIFSNRHKHNVEKILNNDF